VSAPVKVHVVRPKQSWSDFVSKVTIKLALTFFTAWVLMLIVGEVTTWGLGYWHTLLVLLAIRMVQIVPSATFWTHKAEGSTF